MTPDNNDTPSDLEDKEDEQSNEEEPLDDDEENKELPEPEEGEKQEDDTEGTDEDETDSELRTKTELIRVPSGLNQISQSLTALNTIEDTINNQFMETIRQPYLEALESMQASIYTSELFEALQQSVIDPETIAALQEPVIDPKIFQELTEFPALQEPFLDSKLLETLESIGDTPLPIIYETVAALDQIEQQTLEQREPIETPEADTDESRSEPEAVSVFEIFYNAIGVYLSVRSEYLPEETRPHIQSILESEQVSDKKEAFRETVITVKASAGATVLILVEAVRFGFQMTMTIHGSVIKEMIEEQREEDDENDDKDSDGNRNNGGEDEDGDDDDN